MASAQSVSIHAVLPESFKADDRQIFAYSCSSSTQMLSARKFKGKFIWLESQLICDKSFFFIVLSEN